MKRTGAPLVLAVVFLGTVAAALLVGCPDNGSSAAPAASAQPASAQPAAGQPSAKPAGSGHGGW